MPGPVLRAAVAFGAGPDIKNSRLGGRRIRVCDARHADRHNMWLRQSTGPAGQPMSDASNLTREAMGQLLLCSCLYPDQPLAPGAPHVPTLSLEDLKIVADSGPSIGCMISVVYGTLSGLPDQQGQAMLVAAELEYEKCRRRLHVDGIASRTQAVRPECIFLLLRGCCMGAYVSHVCYTTMLDQLAGSVPVNDWSRLQQVVEVLQSHPSSFGASADWLTSLSMEVAVVQRVQPVFDAPNHAEVPDTDLKQLEQQFEVQYDQLEARLSANYHGFTQQYIAAQACSLLCNNTAAAVGHQRTAAVEPNISGQQLWSSRLYENLLGCTRSYMSMLLAGGDKLLDATHGGFCYLTYWLEIQQFALQHTEGKTGPAAVSMAQQLIQQLPHSVLFTRAALRAVNVFAHGSNATGTVLCSTVPLVSPAEMQATILGRGVSSDVKAILQTQAVPERLQKQGRSATFHDAMGGISDRVDGVEGLLYGAGDMPTSLYPDYLCNTEMGAIAPPCLMFSHSSPPDALLDPALSVALKYWIEQANKEGGVERAVKHAWLPAALMQHALIQAGAPTDVAAILVGEHNMSEEYLRPVGEFLERKRTVAKCFAETATNTGWAIDTHTVPSGGRDWSTALGEMWVLSLTADHQVALAAIIWRTASWLASMDSSVKGEQLKARQGTVELLLSIGDHQCAMLQLQNDTGKPQWLSTPLITLLWKAHALGPTPLEPYATARTCAAVEHLLHAAGSDFARLDPSAQVVLQIAAKSLLSVALTPASLRVFAAVPLMHTADYDCLLNKCAADAPEAFPDVWAAAVAAATDLNTAASPAFGGKRPDVAWLTRTLPSWWQQLQQRGLTPTAADLLAPVIAAAGKLQQQPQSAAADGALGSEGSAGSAEPLGRANVLDVVGSLSDEDDSDEDDEYAETARKGFQSRIDVKPKVTFEQGMFELELEASGTGLGALQQRMGQVINMMSATGMLSSKARKQYDIISGFLSSNGSQQDEPPPVLLPQDAAKRLLRAVCSVLAGTAHSGSSSSAFVPLATMRELLLVVRQHPQVAQRLQELPSALCAVVQSAAARGDLSTHSLVVEEVSGLPGAALRPLQLEAGDVWALHWAAVAGAAQAMLRRLPASSIDSSADLLRLWREALSSSGAIFATATAGDDGRQNDPQHLLRLQHWMREGAAAVVAVMAADGQLSTQLLADPLPAGILQQLVLSALVLTKQQQEGLQEKAGGASHIVALMLGHAVQHDLLKNAALSTDTMSQLLTGLLVPSASADLSVVLPLLSQLLQQSDAGQGVKLQQSCVQQLLQRGTATAEGWEQLLAWLTEQGKAAQRTAWEGLVFDLVLEACISSREVGSTGKGSASWQLFQLVQRKQGKRNLALALPAASSLIIQQGLQGTAAAVDRVLGVWRYLNKRAAGKANDASRCFGQLSDGAKDVLLGALVRRGEHSTALQLLQDSPASFRRLAELWSMPAPPNWKQYPVEPQLVQEALQICCQRGSADAASSAALLWALLQQQAEQQGFAVTSVLTGTDAAELVGLLSKPGQLAAAQQVFALCLLVGADGGTQRSAAALAQLATAAAAAGTRAQQKELLQLLDGCQQGTNIVRAAVAQLLSVHQPDAAAVALLLHMPAATSAGSNASSASSGRHVLQLLGPEGLQQLCRLMVSTGGHAHSSGSALLSLPSPLELAAVFLQQFDSAEADKTQGAGGLGLSLVVDLLNAAAVCHPELQPAEAAAALGLVGTAGVAPGSRQQQQQQHVTPTEPVYLSHTVAQLCFHLMRQELTTAGEVRDAAAAWLSQLSPEAAAAALFATWYWAQPNAAAAGQNCPAHNPATLAGLWSCLYARVRESGRPSVESLLPDLGLIAAAALAQACDDEAEGDSEDAQEEQELAWKEGLKVAHAAERVLQDSHHSSSKGGHPTWVPSLPAAQCALLTVLVHTEGVAAAAHTLTAAHQQVQDQTAAGAAADARKLKGQKKAHATSSSTAGAKGAGADLARSLLSAPVVKIFLSAAVDVVSRMQREGEDEQAEAAAQAAVDAVTNVYQQQVVQLTVAAGMAIKQGNMCAASAVLAQAAPAPAQLRPDAVTFLLLSELQLAAGAVKRATEMLVAALLQRQQETAGTAQAPAQQQQQQRAWSDRLQYVVAGLARCCVAAGEGAAVVQLLGALLVGGVSGVSHPGLAQQLLEVAEGEAEQALAAAFVSEDAIYDLWEVAEGGAEGVAVVKLRQQATATAFISVVAALKVVADSSYILAV